MAFPPTARDDIHPPIDASDVLQECRVLYLKSLIQLLQENESLPTPATEKFQAGVGRYFDEMTTTQPKKGFDQSNNLTASCISLLGENDLELEIRLGEFSAQLQEQSGGELWRLYLRFITLLKCPDLAPGDNPVGPKGIAEGIDALGGMYYGDPALYELPCCMSTMGDFHSSGTERYQMCQTNSTVFSPFVFADPASELPIGILDIDISGASGGYTYKTDQTFARTLAASKISGIVFETTDTYDDSSSQIRIDVVEATDDAGNPENAAALFDSFFEWNASPY